MGHMRPFVPARMRTKYCTFSPKPEKAGCAVSRGCRAEDGIRMIRIRIRIRLLLSTPVCQTTSGTDESRDATCR